MVWCLKPDMKKGHCHLRFSLIQMWRCQIYAYCRGKLLQEHSTRQIRSPHCFSLTVLSLSPQPCDRPEICGWAWRPWSIHQYSTYHLALHHLLCAHAQTPTHEHTHTKVSVAQSYQWRGRPGTWAQADVRWSYLSPVSELVSHNTSYLIMMHKKASKHKIITGNMLKCC